MTRKLIAILLLVLLAAANVAAQEKSYDAERFDVRVQTNPDGSLTVEEEVTFRFQGGPFSYVFRDLPTDHTDGITAITAGADGVAWPEGTLPGHVEITGVDPVRVVWHLSPTSNTAQTFDLSYRPLGVIRQGDEADVLEWQALPDDYDYAIAESQVTVSFPPGSELGAPQVTAGNATVSGGDGQAVFTMRDLSPGDPLVFRLNFRPDTFTGSPPSWQTQTDRQNSRAWLWITAAVAVLAAGLGAVVVAARGGARRAPATKALAHKPPVDMPPALAGYLFNTTISWQHGLATLFDLAGRGAVEIEQIEEKRWYKSAEFTVTLLNRPDDLRPHEGALLDILFTDKSGVESDVIAMSEMGRRVTSSRWQQVTDALKHEADSEGLTDPAAKQRARRLVIWGVVLMFLAVPIGALTMLLWSVFGGWPLLLAAAVFLVGIISTIAGAVVSPLSARGVQYADAFDPFRRFLESVSKGKTSLPDPAYFPAYLPYATAFGFAKAWVEQQGDSDYAQVPAYFRALGDSSGAEMVVFIAAVTAATNSGGAAAASAAGAAGAGAAGGGASGAG